MGGESGIQTCETRPSSYLHLGKLKRKNEAARRVRLRRFRYKQKLGMPVSHIDTLDLTLKASILY